MLLVSLRCYYHIVTNRTFYSSSILSPCLICLTISMASPHHENFPRGITGTFFLPSDPDKESLTVTRKWSLPREASFFVHIMVISIYFFYSRTGKQREPGPGLSCQISQRSVAQFLFLLCNYVQINLLLAQLTAIHFCSHCITPQTSFLFLLLDKFSQNSYKLSASALFSGVCQAFSPDSFLWRLPEESKVTIHYGQSFLTCGEGRRGGHIY